MRENDVNFLSNLGVPDYTYGWSKLTGEYLARIAYKKYNIKSICYRPFSGYGEDQDLNYPFPNLCKNILLAEKKKYVNVWGNGKQMRDFIHVDDCVKGVIKTMNKINDGSGINLSTAKFTSFLDFLNIAKEITGFNFKIKSNNSKPVGVFARAGSKKKQNMLGFNASISIKNGIEKGLEYLGKKIY